ncbi:TerD family protein [Nocardia fusca]|uniref:TerD family protein n=1 Tax=Nocardia fusca TaxID=941183 RepID=UPI003F4CDE33
MDVSALLLGTDNKVGSDADFVFYNQPESPDGSVRFAGTEASGSHRARTRKRSGSATHGEQIQLLLCGTSFDQPMPSLQVELELDRVPPRTNVTAKARCIRTAGRTPSRCARSRGPRQARSHRSRWRSRR